MVPMLVGALVTCKTSSKSVPVTDSMFLSTSLPTSSAPLVIAPVKHLQSC